MKSVWPTTGRNGRAVVRGGLALVVLLFAAGLGAPAAAQPAAREYDVKATFLFNFAQFVQWPTNALGDTNAPFVIGLLGADPFGAFLDRLVQNERVHGKPMVVRRYAKVELAFGAHILFISRSEQARLESILDKLRGRPILTVGESGEPSFARQGGMIEMVTARGRVRVRVNQEAAQAARLAISAKLLRIAEIVRPERP